MRIDKVMVRVAAVGLLLTGAAWAGVEEKEKEEFRQIVYKACSSRYESVKENEACHYWFLGD